MTYSLAFYKLCLIKMQHAAQSTFVFRTWGGRREGAGRKPLAYAPRRRIADVPHTIHTIHST